MRRIHVDGLPTARCCAHGSHPAKLHLSVFVCPPCCFVQGLLTKDDQHALENSAISGDVVMNAAFAVALHSQDLDYLSALFKDIASNRRDSPQVLQHPIMSGYTSYFSYFSCQVEATHVDFWSVKPLFIRRRLLCPGLPVQNGVASSIYSRETSEDTRRARNQL